MEGGLVVGLIAEYNAAIHAHKGGERDQYAQAQQQFAPAEREEAAVGLALAQALAQRALNRGVGVENAAGMAATQPCTGHREGHPDCVRLTEPNSERRAATEGHADCSWRCQVA